MHSYIITLLKKFENFHCLETVVHRCSVKVFLEISQKFTRKPLCQSLDWLEHVENGLLSWGTLSRNNWLMNLCIYIIIFIFYVNLNVSPISASAATPNNRAISILLSIAFSSSFRYLRDNLKRTKGNHLKSRGGCRRPTNPVHQLLATERSYWF